jgi:hypothetical protein
MITLRLRVTAFTSTPREFVPRLRDVHDSCIVRNDDGGETCTPLVAGQTLGAHNAQPDILTGQFDAIPWATFAVWRYTFPLVLQAWEGGTRGGMQRAHVNMCWSGTGEQDKVHDSRLELHEKK